MTLQRTIVASTLLLFACAEAPAPNAGGGGLAISVAPLSLPGVTNATYDLEVRNGLGQLVWSRTLDADGFGDGAGSLSYVGPCDADPAASLNTVSLTLQALYEGSAGASLVDPATYQNPGTLTRSVQCASNADTAVAFDLTILRQANQGFFDVAVTFSDIYCSAKLDCVDEEGATLELLHDDGVRSRTAVVALACTGDAASGGETWLYRSDLVVTCEGGAATVDPSAGPGNLAEGAGITSTGVSPLFGAAVYQGVEAPGYNKRSWNVLLGLEADAAGCSVSATATASPDELLGGATPEGTTWPFVIWDVNLTAPATGAHACTNHPVGGAPPNDGVYTDYSALDTPEVFPNAFGPSLPTPTLCASGQTSCPLVSCQAIYDAGLGTADGFYFVDPDGPDTGAATIEVYCGMSLPGGGWTLVGHYAHGGGTMDLSGDAVGATPVTLDGASSQRLSDATITALGAESYLVQSGTSATRNPACDTYYELLTPSAWSTATNYTQVRCSKDLLDWGVVFDPTGVSLNTQSGPGNWELNHCVSSGGADGTTAQWIYNNRNEVQGDDLCANGGGPNDADKWLWVRGAGVGSLCVAGQTNCLLTSCQAIVDAGLDDGDGVYAIDPDGANLGAPAFDAYCEMTTDGGGWTLVRVSNGTTSPDLRTEAAVNEAALTGGPTGDTNAQLASATVNLLGTVLMVENTEAAYDTKLWYDRLRACAPAPTDIYWTYQSGLGTASACPGASSIYPPSEDRWGEDVGGYTHINYDSAHPLCFGSWVGSSKGHFCYNRNSLDWWNYGVDALTSSNGSAKTALWVR